MTFDTRSWRTDYLRPPPLLALADGVKLRPHHTEDQTPHLVPLQLRETQVKPLAVEHETGISRPQKHK